MYERASLLDLVLGVRDGISGAVFLWHCIKLFCFWCSWLVLEGGYYQIPGARTKASKPVGEAFCGKQARKFLPQRKPELILDQDFKDFHIWLFWKQCIVIKSASLCWSEGCLVLLLKKRFCILICYETEKSLRCSLISTLHLKFHQTLYFLETATLRCSPNTLLWPHWTPSPPSTHLPNALHCTALHITHHCTVLHWTDLHWMCTGHSIAHCTLHITMLHCVALSSSLLLFCCVRK